MKSLKISKGAIMTWLTVMEYLCHKCPLVNISRSFPHITWCITRSTRRVPLVEQELRTHPRHLSSPSDFSGGGSCYSVFSFMGMFCRSLFVLFPLVIVLSVLRFTASDYTFVWCLQILLITQQ